jgi:hypothetical protein
MIMIVLQAIIIVAFLALLVLGLLRRNMPRVAASSARSATLIRRASCRADFHESIPAR